MFVKQFLSGILKALRTKDLERWEWLDSVGEAWCLVVNILFVISSVLNSN